MWMKGSEKWEESHLNLIHEHEGPLINSLMQVKNRDDQREKYLTGKRVAYI